MKKIIFIFLFTANFCLAQTYQNGLVLPDFTKVDENEICCIYTPKDGFTVFDSPNGSRVGKLKRMGDSKSDDQAPYKLYFLNSDGKQLKKIDLSNLKEIGYEVWALPYLERKNGYVKVIDSSEDYWLNENEIKANGFILSNWQNFLNSSNGNLLGFYASELGLNLRISPNTNSELLKTLKGDLYEISPLKQNEGPWTKVKVKKYKEHPCGSDLDQNEIVEYELEGWVKLVDDNGLPNVWYYSRGC